MRRPIIITIVLLVITAFVTVVYFKNINAPSSHTGRIMRAIPSDAMLVFEFNNDNGFYDIFKDNKLFPAVLGKDKLHELDTLRHLLFADPLLYKTFAGQNVYISLHPAADKSIDILLTLAAAKDAKPTDMDHLAEHSTKQLLITPVTIAGKKGFSIYSSAIKKRFFLISRGDDIYYGSFSQQLVTQSAQYIEPKEKQYFLQLPDQQNSTSLANLYINYNQLNRLFGLLFKNKNTDIFKSFRLLPAQAALNLNFKSDALLFTGFSNIDRNMPVSYLNLFTNEQPVVNQLKNIFPSTTAYSIDFGVTDPKKFTTSLAAWYTKAHLQHQKDSIFNKVKTETGIRIDKEFNAALSNEFAIVTTKFFEKFGIITLNDGPAFKPIAKNISKMTDDNMGQFNYNKLPFFLLGDAFSVFDHPWFMILDNYLIIANSQNELKSYYDSYINQKFQSKTTPYNAFDKLVAERSNISWYINFKNAQPIFKRDMSDTFFSHFENDGTGWKSFYAASYQLISSGKDFYTSFCMNLNQADTTLTSK